MTYTFKLDSAAWEKAIIHAAGALGRDLPSVYMEEIDLLMRGIIRKTPPKTRSQGMRRVFNDIRFTTVGVEEGMLAAMLQRNGSGRFSGTWNLGKGRVIPLEYARIITSLNELRAWHESKRHGITGRVKNPKGGQSFDNPRKAFVGKRLLKRYIRQAQANVGTAKGGWATAQQVVNRGRALPSWITKHRGHGRVMHHFSRTLGGEQRFVAINNSPFAKRFFDADKVIQSELNNRARTIPKKLEHQLRLRFSAAGFIVRGSDIIHGISS